MIVKRLLTKLMNYYYAWIKKQEDKVPNYMGYKNKKKK